jgi:AcrR family transcriptional regulator
MATMRQRQKEATRAKVLAAAGVCFRTLGYERATIRDIANNAGTSTGAVFANFNDKADLYREVFGHPPVSPEHGRALLLAARDQLQGRGVEALRAVVATIEEA